LDYVRDAFRNILNFDQFRPDLDDALAGKRDFSMHSEIFRVSTNFDQIWITRAMHALPGSLALQPCLAALPASLARQPGLARQPCPPALPASLASLPCPAALNGSLARQPCTSSLAPAALHDSLARQSCLAANLQFAICNFILFYFNFNF
jgi:hypothetical protein